MEPIRNKLSFYNLRRPNCQSTRSLPPRFNVIPVARRPSLRWAGRIWQNTAATKDTTIILRIKTSQSKHSEIKVINILSILSSEAEISISILRFKKQERGGGCEYVNRKKIEISCPAIVRPDKSCQSTLNLNVRAAPSAVCCFNSPLITHPFLITLKTNSFSFPKDLYIHVTDERFTVFIKQAFINKINHFS